MVGYFWGQLVMISVPEEEFGGIDWRFLQWLIPCAVAIGITKFIFVHSINSLEACPLLLIVTFF